ncbi:MAG: DUF3343 domain-containing protein [Clostridia bacterium]|nr:DUF3343 domain-containing protein [Clostridia bacterium]
MLATVASVSSANRLRLALLKQDVPSRVIQTPSSLTKEGCGYSIRFPDEYKPFVKKTAASLNINIRSFFREETNNSQTTYFKE